MVCIRLIHCHTKYIISLKKTTTEFEFFSSLLCNKKNLETDNYIDIKIGLSFFVFFSWSMVLEIAHFISVVLPCFKIIWFTPYTRGSDWNTKYFPFSYCIFSHAHFSKDFSLAKFKSQSAIFNCRQGLAIISLNFFLKKKNKYALF